MKFPRYVCIHGHFYQPPRENPWLEAIEMQDSAHPYHDWNERITAECYAPNSASRITDAEGRILGIVNNYSKISFNFGPTLLSWLEQRAPDVYRALQEADHESIHRFSGHGSAMAQVYNHMILPLANGHDRQTQVIWGIEDFVHRFGRRPEGMWLAESACNTESLEVLAEHGIRFTVLAPSQARRVRLKGSGEWQEVGAGQVDPARCYECRLPSGRSIALFFYDGPISQAVAFEKLLDSGEKFAGRLRSGFSDDRDYPQLVHIATDGETYGHHHSFGDMALAYALHSIERDPEIELTVYGEYLERHPPEWEAEIHENSSWSCVHGVERWRNDCGCSSGHAGWNQQWRGPLRDALDWLRDQMIAPFEEEAGRLFKDPWEARNGYIKVLLERSPGNVDDFLSRHGLGALDEAQVSRALKLMELQRHAMLMYTSCGWFFDELSGIETVQVIQYGARCVQLAEELFGVHLEDGFRDRLALAASNIAEHCDGKCIYDRFVKPAMVDLTKVGAHYAVSSLFHAVGDRTRIYAFEVDREDLHLFESGRSRLAIGKARVTSDVTRESLEITYAVLHFGDHNLTAGVRWPLGDEAYDSLVREASSAFLAADLPQVVRVLDHQFYGLTFSLASLFKDEQRRVLDSIMGSLLEQTASTFRMVFQTHSPLMHYLKQLGAPQPEVLEAAGRFVLGSELMRAVEEGVPDRPRVRALLADARALGLPLDTRGLDVALEHRITERAEELRRQSYDVNALENLAVLVEIARQVTDRINLWRAQNVFYDILREDYPHIKALALGGDEESKTWIEVFRLLGTQLRVKVD